MAAPSPTSPSERSSAPLHVLLTGAMGSGKSYASAYLAREHGAMRWSRTELMKRLAHALADHVGSPDVVLELLFPDPEERQLVRDALIKYVRTQYVEEPGKPRRLYQDVTQICQDQDPLCFERELASRIDDVDSVAFSLIDDVRSLDAFQFFSERGYVTVRIEASEDVRRKRMKARDGYLPSEETFNHPSETQLNNVPHDYVIDNNSDDPQALYGALDELIGKLRAGERPQRRPEPVSA